MMPKPKEPPASYRTRLQLIRSFGSLALLVALGSCGDRAVAPLPGTIPVGPPRSDSCFSQPSSGLSTLECEGLTLQIHVPKTCLSYACGLILDLHGFNQSGPVQEQHTELGDIAGEAGFIVLQPTAPGQPARWLPAHDGSVLALVERAARVFQVAPNRIHATGYSLGGFMTWRLTCARGELFGSVAVLAAGESDGTSDPATTNGCFDARLPSHELDILYAHGTADTVVPFVSAGPLVGAIRSAWDLNERTLLAEDPEYLWERFRSGRGTTLEFLEHSWETDFVGALRPLRGHCFPGSSARLGCGAENPLHWGEAVTRFFLAHPKD